MNQLHLSAASGNPVGVQEALQQKIDINSRTEPNGFTPLHMAISGTDSPERQKIIKLLHAAGAKLELKTFDKGLTPLQLASMRGKPLCVSALLQCGADINAVEGNEATALHGAAYYGFYDVCKILLQAGADPNKHDIHGNTPAKLAKAKGDPRLTSLFMNHVAPSGKKENNK